MKASVFFALLLLSSNAFSFPTPVNSDTDDQIALAAEVEQEDHELSNFDNSSAPAPQFLQKNFCDAILFRLASERLEVLTRSYLKFSAEITPGLDASRLIFPFHFFF